MMASLLLAGAVSAQTNYWGDNPDSHAQPSNTPIVASVQIDGQDVTATEAMRLGAFVGNDLRGIAAKHTDGKFWIQVFYATASDEITFKFYDGTTEYTTCAATLEDEAVTLTGLDEGYGTPGIPVVLNFTNAAEQTVELAAGNNWWSTNLDVTIDNLKNALATAMSNTGSIRITAQNGSFIIYNGTGWMGNLTALDVNKFYIINLTESCELTLTGQPINPAEHPITIVPNNNWISFPLSEPTAVSTAFSGFDATNNDRVTAKDGTFAIHMNGNWLGNLQTLQPGKGYIYSSKATESKTLTFQSSAD